MLELLLDLNRVEGTTLVLVTHDPVLARMRTGGLCCATGWWFRMSAMPDAAEP